jgi:hypothetical protein
MTQAFELGIAAPRSVEEVPCDDDDLSAFLHGGPGARTPGRRIDRDAPFLLSRVSPRSRRSSLAHPPWESAGSPARVCLGIAV